MQAHNRQAMQQCTALRHCQLTHLVMTVPCPAAQTLSMHCPEHGRRRRAHWAQPLAARAACAAAQRSSLAQPQARGAPPQHGSHHLLCRWSQWLRARGCGAWAPSAAGRPLAALPRLRRRARGGARAWCLLRRRAPRRVANAPAARRRRAAAMPRGQRGRAAVSSRSRCGALWCQQSSFDPGQTDLMLGSAQMAHLS
jgi:hypothetical protein